MPKRHRPGVSASSILRHVEEIVLATSGEDTFEVVFSIAAARLNSPASANGRGSAADLRRRILDAARRYPTLEVDRVAGASDELLVRVDALLRAAMSDDEGRGARGATLDAVFESLVPRIAKSDKGQFFTPRHVVDFMIRMLAPAGDEVVVDPSCGSGAFLSRARGHAETEKKPSAFGCDIDVRAVRVARLLSLSDGADPSSILQRDGLHRAASKKTDLPTADVIATNPPFAGRAPGDGFEVAKLVRTPERDVLFLDRSIGLLRPGGRLGIVLPYNKASGSTFAQVRRWLVDRARVLAIVGLPRETFLPHTSQRTFVLFARKREANERAMDRERTMFLVSERAGKDTGGEPIFAATSKSEPRALDHDLGDVTRVLEPFLRAEGFGVPPAKTRTKTKTRTRR